MIFVTVGTHEQQFNRLVEKIDWLKKEKIIQEEVIIQSGYCTYIPKYCKFSKLFSYEEMRDYMKNARIIISHGGPSTFIMPLQIGKVPIVVPRQVEFSEHINNHQVDFVKEVEERQKNIIAIYDINELENCLVNYDRIVSNLTNKVKSNNKKFNQQIEAIISNLFS